MKKLLVPIMAVLMIVGLLPFAAVNTKAADITCFESEFNLDNIQKPDAPYAKLESVYEDGSNHHSWVTLWYTCPEVIRNLAETFESYGKSDKGYQGFRDEFLIYDDYRINVQIDAKLANDGENIETQKWLSQIKGSNYLKENFGYEFCSVIDQNSGNSDMLREVLQSSLAHYDPEDHNDNALFGGYIKTTMDSSYNYVYQFKEDTTIAYRYRYEIRYRSTEEGFDGEDRSVFSPWSDATIIGKNGTQVQAKDVTPTPAPVLSEFVLNPVEYGYNVDYYMTIPDDLYKSMLYCSAVADQFEPFCIESQFKIGDGEWQDAYTANPTSMSNGYRYIFLEDEVYSSGSDIWIRCRFRKTLKDKVTYSSWSNILGTKAYKETNRITVTATTGGTAKANLSTASMGTVVTLSYTPSKNYQFKGWTVVKGGVALSGNNFIMGNTDVEIKAIFEKTIDNTIINQKTDNDVSGSTYGLLQAKVATAYKTSLKISWKTNVKGVQGYLIYGNKCGVKNKYKLIKTITSAKTASYTYKKLKKGTYYKFIVIGYKNAFGSKHMVATSKTIHATTTGGKYGNAKAVKITKVGTSTKTSITLKVKKTAQIKASQVKKDKTIAKHRGLCYESSNKAVATVSSAGKITAKGKGKCTIYVYAQNGVYKAVSVTVK